MANSHANDAMIRRLEKELEERNAAAQGIIGNAQDGERDLNDAEKETLAGIADRIDRDPLAARRARVDRRARRPGPRPDAASFDQALTTARRIAAETRSSTGPPAPTCSTTWPAQIGSQQARGTARGVQPCRRPPEDLGQPRRHPRPDHRRVINFIDAARPIGVVPRPAEHAVGDVVPAEGDPARPRRGAGFRRCGRR